MMVFVAVVFQSLLHIKFDRIKRIDFGFFFFFSTKDGLRYLISDSDVN